MERHIKIDRAGSRVVRPRDFLARLVWINKQAVWGSLTKWCVRLYIVDKKADIFQHIPRIALSFNGRTSDFGSDYRGSNPRGATWLC